MAFVTFLSTEDSVFKKLKYRLVSSCKDGRKLSNTFFASLFSSNAFSNFGCMGKTLSIASYAISKFATSPTSFLAAFRMGVLRYNRQEPLHFMSVCVNSCPSIFILTGIFPLFFPACLKTLCNTLSGRNTKGLTPIISIFALNLIMSIYGSSLSRRTGRREGWALIRVRPVQKLPYPTQGNLALKDHNDHMYWCGKYHSSTGLLRLSY